MKYSLASASDIPAGGSMQYSIEHNGETLELFVLEQAGKFYAYENCCPHMGVNLNWQTDVFLDIDRAHIQCATHGAQFRIDNGLCEWGPCLGQSLRQLELKLVDGKLILKM